jgi:hypothetical protein
MKRFLLYFLLSLPALAHAQINLKKGYIVKHSGDTVRGYIDYRERGENPEQVRFTKSLDEKTLSLGFEDCLAFGIDDIISYEGYVVSVSQSQESLSYLSKGVDTTSKRDTVFLEVMSAGDKISLYKYRDKIKTRYYIKEHHNAVPQELIRHVFFNPDKDDSMVTLDRFRLQLINVNRNFNGSNRTDEVGINRLRYSDSDLIRFVEKINQVKHVKQRVSKTRFFVGSGLNVSHASYSGQTRLAEAESVSKTSSLPTFSAGVDYLANPSIGKMVYRLELNYSSTNGDIFREGDSSYSYSLRHQFKQLNLSVIPQILYHFYAKEKIKVFISAGVGLNFPNYKKNQLSATRVIGNVSDVYMDQVGFEEFYYSFQGKGGLVFSKRFELSAGYIFNTAITNYSYYNVNVDRITLGLNYFFGAK